MRTQACLVSALLVFVAKVSASFSYLDVAPGDAYEHGMLLDYYDSLKERFDAVGRPWDDITATYKVYDSSIDGVHQYVSVTLTNRDIFARYTHNGRDSMPHLKRSIIQTLDDRLFDVDGDYMQWWLGGNTSPNDSMKNYFSLTNITGSVTNHPQVIPDVNPAAMFSYLGMGWVTNRSYNDYGAITDAGAAMFTRRPAISSTWVVVSFDWSPTITANEGWGFGAQYAPDHYTSLDQVQFFDGHPRPDWIPSSTTGWSTVTITMTGQAHSGNGVQYAASETVDIPAEGATCTQSWTEVATVAFDDPSSVTNAALTLSYTNAMPLYGDIPWSLYAKDLRERYEYVRALVSVGNQETLSSAPGDVLAANSVSSNNTWCAQMWMRLRSTYDSAWYASSPGVYRVESEAVESAGDTWSLSTTRVREKLRHEVGLRSVDVDYDTYISLNRPGNDLIDEDGVLPAGVNIDQLFNFDTKSLSDSDTNQVVTTDWLGNFTGNPSGGICFLGCVDDECSHGIKRSGQYMVERYFDGFVFK